MKEITFILGPERRSAEVWDIMGTRDRTLEASCTYPTTDGRNLRIVVADSDAEEAKAGGLEAGLASVDERDVLIIDIDNEPGALGVLAGKVRDAGASLQVLYMATGDRVVVGSDQLEAISRVLTGD